MQPNYVNYREHASKIKLPANVQDMKELAEVLREYKKAYLFHVSLIYSLVFVLYVSVILLSLFIISANQFGKQLAKLLRTRHNLP